MLHFLKTYTTLDGYNLSPIFPSPLGIQSEESNLQHDFTTITGTPVPNLNLKQLSTVGQIIGQKTTLLYLRALTVKKLLGRMVPWALPR